jgi:hypothetical protein
MAIRLEMTKKLSLASLFQVFSNLFKSFPIFSKSFPEFPKVFSSHFRSVVPFAKRYGKTRQKALSKTFESRSYFSKISTTRCQTKNSK